MPGGGISTGWNTKEIELRIPAGGLLPVGLLLACVPARAQMREAFAIDAAKSKLELDVYREGLLKIFGHDHRIVAKEFTGLVLLDPEKMENSSVTFVVQAKSLAVVDPGESDKDRREVQAAMEGDKVLQVEKFPRIAFASTGVTQAKKTGESWELTLAGTLDLHGVKKPVFFPLKLLLEDGQLRAQGELFLRQSDFGMTPIRAGGGAVRVRDRVRIRFEIVAVKGHDR